MSSNRVTPFLSRDVARALTLRADCLAVAGDLSRASDGYALVARLFAELPAGEDALFASGRLDSERLSGEGAETGLIHYLARYPRGKFVQEATARLRELRANRPQP